MANPTYTVRLTFEQLTDGKVTPDGSVVIEEHSDELPVHGVKVVAMARALGALLPNVAEQMFALATEEWNKVLAEQGGKGK